MFYKTTFSRPKVLFYLWWAKGASSPLGMAKDAFPPMDFKSIATFVGHRLVLTFYGIWSKLVMHL